TSANVGIFGLATLAARVAVTPDHWRWILLPAAAPGMLGLFALAVVPESPLWLARRRTAVALSLTPRKSGLRPPLLGGTLVAIALATVPLVGGWGSANWMVPWADDKANPFLKAHVSQARALTGIVGSLLGGWVAALVGRRLCYCLISLAALFCAQWT